MKKGDCPLFFYARRVKNADSMERGIHKIKWSPWFIEKAYEYADIMDVK